MQIRNLQLIQIEKEKVQFAGFYFHSSRLGDLEILLLQSS